MKYKYLVEIEAIKELVVEADSREEADIQADLITSTETIPINQEDIIDIRISDDNVDDLAYWSDEYGNDLRSCDH
jgi:hypothetical protein